MTTRDDHEMHPEPAPRGHDDKATARRDGERRNLLGSGVTSAATALLGVFAVACTDDESGSGGQGGGGTSTGEGGNGQASTATTAQGTSTSTSTPTSSTGQGGEGGGGSADADIEPLNALLTAEYLAITAYTAGAGLIGDADAGDPLFDLGGVITDIAVSFQTDHRLHAEALADAIAQLGGTPVDEADVSATFEAPQALLDNPTITNVLKFAASAERGAAVAYNQVLGSMESAQIRFLAGAIEGDEAQHFIVLTALIAGLAAPGVNLSSETATDVVPQAFVFTVGDEPGLDAGPPDYFP